MTSFTDENLKHLKDAIPLMETYGRWLTNGEKVQALIARLEASENLIPHNYGREEHSGDCTKEAHTCMRCLYEAWRKSKGEVAQT